MRCRRLCRLNDHTNIACPCFVRTVYTSLYHIRSLANIAPPRIKRMTCDISNSNRSAAAPAVTCTRPQQRCAVRIFGFGCMRKSVNERTSFPAPPRPVLVFVTR
ncbi:hypothetical protein EVAR_4755_1 [Eumeta japonica]|uniref:Uncharacterized protein n=1 Tax=Eumeta variegata TaxID=151549 RepID=A0A4C1SZR4_EUMVA|nr:hypothetical protein EVAR_4755_1 [Eumeta japonica]